MMSRTVPPTGMQRFSSIISASGPLGPNSATRPDFLFRISNAHTSLGSSKSSSTSSVPAKPNSSDALSSSVNPGSISTEVTSLLSMSSSRLTSSNTITPSSKPSILPPAATLNPPQLPNTMSTSATPSKSPVKDATTTSGPNPPRPTNSPPSNNSPTTTPPPVNTHSSTQSHGPSSTSRTRSTDIQSNVQSPSPKPPGSLVVPKTTTRTTIETSKSTPTIITSTITDEPQTTLSSPVAVSVIDPNNGIVSFTTPAIVTVLSTSTEPDGELVTYTHVVANPTGFQHDQAASGTGFLANHGAVAGVFVVVGIVTCAVGVCLAFFLRRRRRRERRRRWLASIQQPMHSNPFEDPSNSPQMRNMNTSRQAINWDGGSPFLFGDHARRTSIQSSNDAAPLMHAGHPNSPRRVPVPIHDILDEPVPNISLGLGTGYGRTFASNYQNRAPSLAQSSPSIYPASLPPSGDSDTNDTGQSPATEHSIKSQFRSILEGGAVPPPRPPRSHLRRSVTKPFETYPITPPTSVSSHTSLNPPSPILDQIKLVNRRTLLDVRPRPSHDTFTQET